MCLETLIGVLDGHYISFTRFCVLCVIPIFALRPVRVLDVVRVLGLEGLVVFRTRIWLEVVRIIATKQNVSRETLLALFPHFSSSSPP